MDIIYCPHNVFCNVDGPTPSHDVTDSMRLWILEKYNVHIVKLWHKVFYAKHVCVFIDIAQLKKGSLTVWALYAYFSDSQNAAFELLVKCM